MKTREKRPPRLPDAIYWVGVVPQACGLCFSPIGKSFVDGATQRGWIPMHPTCHATFGQGFGANRGQRYDLGADQRWMRVQG